MRALTGGAGPGERRQARARGRQPLEPLLWHPAGFSVLELKVWSTIRRRGPTGIVEAASVVGGHRVSVGRAIRRLRDAGLLAGDGCQPRR